MIFLCISGSIVFTVLNLIYLDKQNLTQNNPPRAKNTVPHSHLPVADDADLSRLLLHAGGVVPGRMPSDRILHALLKSTVLMFMLQYENNLPGNCSNPGDNKATAPDANHRASILRNTFGNCLGYPLVYSSGDHSAISPTADQSALLHSTVDLILPILI